MTHHVSARRCLVRLVDAISVAIVAGAGILLVARVALDAFGRLHDRPDGRVEPAAFAEAIAEGHWLGPREAPVVLLVYSSYTCGFCAEFHTTLTRLRERYPQHLGVVVKPFAEPSGLTTYMVPLAAECASEQERFVEYHEAAFRNGSLLQYSRGWLHLADSAQVPDRAEFDRCVRSRRYTDRVVSAYKEAKGFGVSVTPTSFVNGDPVVGVAPLAVLDSIIATQFRNRSRR